MGDPSVCLEVSAEKAQGGCVTARHGSTWRTHSQASTCPQEQVSKNYMHMFYVYFYVKWHIFTEFGVSRVMMCNKVNLCVTFNENSPCFWNNVLSHCLSWGYSLYLAVYVSDRKPDPGSLINLTCAALLTAFLTHREWSTYLCAGTR